MVAAERGGQVREREAAAPLDHAMLEATERPFFQLDGGGAGYSEDGPDDRRRELLDLLQPQRRPPSGRQLGKRTDHACGSWVGRLGLVGARAGVAVDRRQQVVAELVGDVVTAPADEANHPDEGVGRGLGGGVG